MSSVSTASTYINNLLLSRGLLRNGTPIAFAELEALERKYDSKHGGKAGEEAKKMEGTTAAAMTLVHDLVLRRDVSAAISSLSLLSYSALFGCWEIVDKLDIGQGEGEVQVNQAS